MEIEKKYVSVKELCEGYTAKDGESNEGIYAFGGKLCLRPPFQRSFVYKDGPRDAVIDTVLQGFPLSLMYWVDNGDGTFGCLDGQQRSISICEFAEGNFSLVDAEGKRVYITTLENHKPELAEDFMNYQLEVRVCKGTKEEQLAWFRRINIAGAQLTDQELRNANYVSAWLDDAKRYFSKASVMSNKKCPAEIIGKDYVKADASRQELLEKVLGWAANSAGDAAICNYMDAHMRDADASALWQYYQDVIEWIKFLFSENTHSGMSGVEWGLLYNLYHNEEFDPDEIDELYNDLLKAKECKDITCSIAKICEYCITRDESLLTQRAFDETQKKIMYKKQEGICPDCGKQITFKQMHAHHILPYMAGGRTEIDNGVMLCSKCHTARHAYTE